MLTARSSAIVNNTCSNKIILMIVICRYRLKDETAILMQKKNRLQEKLDKHVIFHKFLEKVLEISEEFHEIREVKARYETLTATHEDLLQSEQENQEKVEERKQELMKYSEVCALTV